MTRAQNRLVSDGLARPHGAIFPRIEEFGGMRALLASAAMCDLMERAKRVAPTGHPVLITGESGSGKELVARAIHQVSGVAGPFVDINCAAFPEHLIESELFGYEKGAFSGADTMKPGLFEAAQNGTLFLDEIGELDPRIQAKLLRVLDGQPYFRLGGTRKVKPEARIVAATNVALAEAVESGRFRKDLYYRLHVFTLEVPPLRERKADISALTLMFLEASGLTIESTAQKLLGEWHWPGNVRELRNVVMTAALFATGPQILSHDLPEEIRARQRNTCHPEFSLELMERRTIIKVLQLTSNHQQRAANLLGISRRTLIRKLKIYREVGLLPASLPGVDSATEPAT